MTTAQLKVLEDDPLAERRQPASQLGPQVHGIRHARPRPHLPQVRGQQIRHVRGRNLAEHKKLKGTRRERPLDEVAVEKCGFYLPPDARYDYLLNLPEKPTSPRRSSPLWSRSRSTSPSSRAASPRTSTSSLSASPSRRSFPSSSSRTSPTSPRRPPATPSALSTSTSSATSPSRRGRVAASSSRRAPLSASWSRSSSLSTGRSSIRPAARAACSSSRPASSRSAASGRRRLSSSPTARRRPSRPSTSPR